MTKRIWKNSDGKIKKIYVRKYDTNRNITDVIQKDMNGNMINDRKLLTNVNLYSF